MVYSSFSFPQDPSVTLLAEHIDGDHVAEGRIVTDSDNDAIFNDNDHDDRVCTNTYIIIFYNYFQYTIFVRYRCLPIWIRCIVLAWYTKKERLRIISMVYPLAMKWLTVKINLGF